MKSNISHILILVAILVQICTPSVIQSQDPSRYFTPKEKVLIKQLRERVKRDLTQPIMYEDGYLLRFLRAKNHDLEEAENMIRENLAWRKEESMDTIFEEDWTSWIEKYPFSLNIADIEGRFAMGTRIGKMDVRGIVLGGQQKLLDRYLTYGYERGLYNIQQHINKTGFIDGYLLMNMAGYNARSQGCLACLSSWINLVLNYERYYPQLVTKIIVINTPRIFMSVFEIMRPSLSFHTAKIVDLYDYNIAEWKRELLKIFPENILTPEFGGKGPYVWCKSIHNADIKRIINYNNQTNNFV